MPTLEDHLVTDERTHALYRFYAHDGTLLYVGITNNPSNRFTQHSADKPWWHEVSGITMERYPDRPAVLAAEARAITVENPRYNKARPKTKTTAHRRPEIVWLCAACGQPIANGQGYIHVSTATVREVERFWEDRARAEHTAEARGDITHLFVNLSDIHSWPKPAPWLAHHADCDPDRDANDYWFDVKRARTHAQLLSWTAHLLESKSWLSHTDWYDVIGRLAGVDA